MKIQQSLSEKKKKRNIAQKEGPFKKSLADSVPLKKMPQSAKTENCVVRPS